METFISSKRFMEMGKVGSDVYFSCVEHMLFHPWNKLVILFLHSIHRLAQLLFREISDITNMKSEYRKAAQRGGKIQQSILDIKCIILL